MKILYQATNYRNFLRNIFPSKGEKRGQRRDLAKTLGCQTSFISLVLTDRAHLSEDMLFSCAQYLHLNGKETEFLLLLYHFERANSESLRGHYQSKIQAVLTQHSQVKERIGVSKVIPVEIQAQYYSNWTYAAIHTAVMNPKTRSLSQIARKLRIPEKLVEENLRFLESWKFVQRNGDRFEPGVNRLHLSPDSPFIVQHHRNWHVEAMRAVGEKNELDLNYSGALSMSKEDVGKIREILLGAIGGIEKQIQASPDEETLGITLGFFLY